VCSAKPMVGVGAGGLFTVGVVDQFGCLTPVEMDIGGDTSCSDVLNAVGAAFAGLRAGGEGVGVILLRAGG